MHGCLSASPGRVVNCDGTTAECDFSCFPESAGAAVVRLDPKLEKDKEALDVTLNTFTGISKLFNEPSDCVDLGCSCLKLNQVCLVTDPVFVRAWVKNVLPTIPRGMHPLKDKLIEEYLNNNKSALNEDCSRIVHMWLS